MSMLASLYARASVTSVTSLLLRAVERRWYQRAGVASTTRVGVAVGGWADHP
jgi:hypothetical protein